MREGDTYKYDETTREIRRFHPSHLPSATSKHQTSKIHIACISADSQALLYQGNSHLTHQLLAMLLFSAIRKGVKKMKESKQEEKRERDQQKSSSNGHSQPVYPEGGQMRPTQNAGKSSY
jgi:hypothetical protein